MDAPTDGQADAIDAVQQQVDGMRAAGYHRSEILGSDVYPRGGWPPHFSAGGSQR